MPDCSEYKKCQICVMANLQITSIIAWYYRSDLLIIDAKVGSLNNYGLINFRVHDLIVRDESIERV